MDADLGRHESSDRDTPCFRADQGRHLPEQGALPCVCATAQHLEQRHPVSRFLLLQRTVFQNPASYFHHYKDLGPEEARAAGRRIWSEINAVNLSENILPTRERAHVVVRKGADHSVAEVALRQL